MNFVKDYLVAQKGLFHLPTILVHNLNEPFSFGRNPSHYTDLMNSPPPIGIIQTLSD